VVRRVEVLFHGFSDQQAGRPLLGISNSVTSFDMIACDVWYVANVGVSG
jgi:hypothetical protein